MKTAVALAAVLVIGAGSVPVFAKNASDVAVTAHRHGHWQGARAKAPRRNAGIESNDVYSSITGRYAGRDPDPNIRFQLQTERKPYW